MRKLIGILFVASCFSLSWSQPSGLVERVEAAFASDVPEDDLTRLIESFGPPAAAHAMTKLGLQGNADLKRFLKVAEGEGTPFSVFDGAGDPLPGALLEIFGWAGQELESLARLGFPEEQLVWRTMTDDQGVARLKFSDRHRFRFAIRVYAPGYGSAVVRMPTRTPAVRVPLIHDRSPLLGRVATGVVQDEAGVPIVDMPIKIQSIYLGPGSYSVARHATAHDDGLMLTDYQGVFRGYYPPNIEGQLVAPTMEYKLQFDLHPYFPAEAKCPANEARFFTMKKSPRFHRFEFPEDKKMRGGWRLKYHPKVEVPSYYRGDRARAYRQSRERDSTIRMPDRIVQEGGYLLPGFYIFENFRVKDVRRVEVTTNSPEVIRVEAPERNQVIEGVVQDGITGKGLAGAIVLAIGASRSGELEPTWDGLIQELVDAPDEEFFAHPRLHELAEAYEVHHVMRADDQGRFRIDLSKPLRPIQRNLPNLPFPFPQNTPKEVRTFIGMYPGKLSYKTGVSWRARNEPLPPYTKLPSIDLYPEAQLKVRFRLPPDHKVEAEPGRPAPRVSVYPRWRFAPEEDQPAPWYPRFAESEDRVQTGSDGFFHHRTHLPVDEYHHLKIPAGVRLHLWFDSRVGLAHRPVEFFTAKPGEQIDLGDVVLQADIRVPVKVLDARGNPVEGAEVRYLHEKSWQIGKVTAPNGVTPLLVPRGLPVTVAVLAANGKQYWNGREEGMEAEVELTEPPRDPIILRLPK